ncbi:gamma-glutamyl hydrolase-like [Chironomus tepperi]|uniref:gamma-glutamyl hydrolase-like n=1 Tax=Chironomus tepperi TaxID=113505 RepID=UPI00391F5E39
MEFAHIFTILTLIVSGISSDLQNFDIFSSPVVNNEPIIGIMAIDMSYYIQSKYTEQYYSFIATSYVKFVEGGGARVVPVWIGKDRKYYEDIMSKLNGILFTGGAVWFYDSAYAYTGKIIYEIAKQLNENGDFFPLWGTCLGFELLTYLSANRSEHRADCSSTNQALNLEFKDDFRTSRMFKDAGDEVVDILKTEEVTSNFHEYCVTEKNLTTFKIDTDWRVISTNKDWNNFEFISSIEHKRYPFYGVQFHPEKNLYEWVRNKNISHTQNAVLASQYFAQFFVNEARKSSHKFKDSKTEDQHVIYNFPLTFTGLVGSSYEQCYLFKDDVDYSFETGTGSRNSIVISIVLGFLLVIKMMD